MQHSGTEAYFFLRFCGGIAIYFAVATLITSPVLIPLNVMVNSHDQDLGLDLLRWTGTHASSVYISVHTAVIMLLTALLTRLIGCEWSTALRFQVPDSRQHCVVLHCSQRLSQSQWDLLVPIYASQQSHPSRFSSEYHSRVAKVQSQVYKDRQELEAQVTRLLSQSLRDRRPFNRLASECDHIPRYRHILRRFMGRATTNPYRCAENLAGAFTKLSRAVVEQRPTEGRTLVLRFDDPFSAMLASLTQVTRTPPSADVPTSDPEKKTVDWTDRALSYIPTLVWLKRFLWALPFFTSQPEKFIVHAKCVQLDEIRWENLDHFTPRNRLWKWLTRCALVGLILAWTVPIAFAGTLSQLESLSSYSPSFRWTKSTPPSILSIFQACLPALLTSVLIAAFQPVLRLIIASRREVSRCEEELSIGRYHFAFLWIHLFLNTSIASGLAASLTKIAANPNATMVLLAENLPSASNFYLAYILLRVFVDAGTTVAQSLPLVQNILLAWQIVTPRRLEKRSIRRMKDWGTISSIYTVMSSISR